MSGLEPLPRPDGAPFRCSMDLPMATWPFVERCPAKAAGMLPQNVMDALPGACLGGRMVCAEHGAFWLAEVAR